MKQQVSDLHQYYVRQSQVVNPVLSESNQYHKTTMLVGGMTNFDSKSDAEGWIKKKMQDLGIALPAKIESRSDLPGLLFCTFESEILRNTAVNTLKNAALNRLWIIASAPLYVRVPRSFLLGIRYLLIQWGYSKSQVRVDDEAMILKIDGVECCSAFVAESEFNIAWHGDFSTSEELHNDSEVVKLLILQK